MTIRLADHDWLTAPTDAPANVRFEGLIDPAGVTITQQLGWWPAGDTPAQAASATVGLLDPDGVLDDMALGDISGVAVAIEQVDIDGTYADKTSIARFVGDRLAVGSDLRKTLHLRDAHDALDDILNPGEFAASVEGLAGQTQPTVIGAVANAPVLLTGSDGSVGWLSDAPVEVGTLRDRGDPMEPGTYTPDTYGQQLRMESPPIGPMTADVSSVGLTGGGDPMPATLVQTLRELFRRAGVTAWSLADAQAIDTATGYAGIGYYADRKTSVRHAVQAALLTYGAWYYQDATGVLRFARIVEPGIGTPAWTLDGSDLAEDLTFTNDTAPALTTRMAWRPNARIMGESDFVTDLVDVPPALRARLSSEYAGIVTASGSVATEYRSALDAPPYVSLFWREQDAQTEINRRAAMYATAKRTYVAKVKGDLSFAPLPGQILRLTYPRYGLDAGRNLLVRRVDRNPATGECTCYLWGQ